MSEFNLAKRVVTEHPDIWQALHPRQYVGAADCCPAEVPAVFLGLECATVKRGVRPAEIQKLLLLAAGKLAAGRVPTFHVGRDLVAATERTRPPEGLRWDQVPFPHPAGLFLLPSGAVTVGGRSWGWVAWCRLSPAELVKVPGFWDRPMPVVSADGTDVVIFATGAFRADGSHAGALVRNHSFGSVATLAESVDWDWEGLEADESRAMDVLADLATKLILAMSARPELVERDGVRVRTVKAGPAREEWTPNWVGRAYRLQRADGDGTHASPRLHWRRGHFRQQPCGAGGRERKTIWLEPVLVGAA